RAVEPFVRGFEAAAEDAFLHPRLALGELAVGGEAGELRARAGAAGRAVVRLARAEHEVTRLRAGGNSGAEQLDVVDIGMSLRIERLADAPGDIREALDVLEPQLLAVLLDEEEAVPAPGNVAGDAAKAGHFDADRFLLAPARHVGHRHSPIACEGRAHDADRRVDAMLAGLDAPEVRERDHQADRAVAAHADRADVVEVDDAGGAAGLRGLDQQRADDDIRAARLVDARGAEAVELAREAIAPLGEAPAAEVRQPVHDYARRLTAGVGIDDLDAPHARHSLLPPSEQPVEQRLEEQHERARDDGEENKEQEEVGL